MSDSSAPPALDASQLAAQELQNRFISETYAGFSCSSTGLSATSTMLRI